MTTTAPDQQTMRIKLAEAMGWTVHQIEVLGMADVAILPPGVSITDTTAVFNHAGIDLPDPFSDYAALAAAREAICDSVKTRRAFIKQMIEEFGFTEVFNGTDHELYKLLTAPLATQATALYRVLREKDGK